MHTSRRDVLHWVSPLFAILRCVWSRESMLGMEWSDDEIRNVDRSKRRWLERGGYQRIHRISRGLLLRIPKGNVSTISRARPFMAHNVLWSQLCNDHVLVIMVSHWSRRSTWHFTALSHHDPTSHKMQQLAICLCITYAVYCTTLNVRRRTGQSTSDISRGVSFSAEEPPRSLNVWYETKKQNVAAPCCTLYTRWCLNCWWVTREGRGILSYSAQDVGDIVFNHESKLTKSCCKSEKLAVYILISYFNFLWFFPKSYVLVDHQSCSQNIVTALIVKPSIIFWHSAHIQNLTIYINNMLFIRLVFDRLDPEFQVDQSRALTWEKAVTTSAAVSYSPTVTSASVR